MGALFYEDPERCCTLLGACHLALLKILIRERSNILENRPLQVAYPLETYAQLSLHAPENGTVQPDTNGSTTVPAFVKWWSGKDLKMHWECRVFGALQEFGMLVSSPLDNDINQLLQLASKDPHAIQEAYSTANGVIKILLLQWMTQICLTCPIIGKQVDMYRDQLTQVKRDRIEVGRNIKHVQSEKSGFEETIEDDPMQVDDDDTNLPELLTSRQMSLKKKDQEKVVKSIQLEKKREQARLKRRLDDEERTLLRKEKEAEKLFSKYSASRCKPLGMDRWFRRYWFLNDIAGNVEASAPGRIFIEPPIPSCHKLMESRPPMVKERWFKELSLHEDTACSHWLYVDSEELFDEMIGRLDAKGERERQLLGQLQSIKADFCGQLDSVEGDVVMRRRTRNSETEVVVERFQSYVNKLKK
jgi:hypothetical protein